MAAKKTNPKFVYDISGSSSAIRREIQLKPDPTNEGGIMLYDATNDLMLLTLKADGHVQLHGYISPHWPVEGPREHLIVEGL